MNEWLSKGILKGYENGKVYPDRQVTRAEFLSILHKGFDSQDTYDVSDKKGKFSDVKESNWYYKDVLKAVDEGFIKGYPNNTFQPNKTLTRQEAAVILANKLNLKEDNLNLLKEYKDSNTVADWANTSFSGVLNHAILQGYPDKTLMPKNLLTRAEAVTLLDKAIKFESSNKTTLSPPTNPEGSTGIKQSGNTQTANASTSSADTDKKSKKNNIDTKLDSDKDGLPDYKEEMIGTDKHNPDTDGDGLTDGQEVNLIGTNPLKIDTDGNGVNDGDEDSDGDGLTNAKEIQLGTNPNNKDSDFDGWEDAYELKKGTNPLEADTDLDGLKDSIEEKFGMDPLNPDTNGNGIKDGDEPVEYKTEIKSYERDRNVTPSVKIVSNAKEATSTVITNVYGEEAFINKNIPGYIGAPFEFTTDVKFNTAAITFEYNPILESDDFRPEIFYYNKEKQLLEKVENQTYDPSSHSVTAIVPHFSTYILLNGKAWDAAWAKEIRLPKKDPSTGRERKVDVVFSIDTSGSMSWNDPKNMRLKAVSNFVSKLEENDRAAIYQFDNYSVQRIALTSDKQSVQDAVYQVSGDGGTNIYSALDSALTELEQNGEDNHDKFIVLLTDGQGTRNNEFIDDAIQKAKSEKISVYTIGLGESIDERMLKRIASETGGSYFHATTAESIDLAYEHVADETIDASLVLDSDKDGIPDYFEINGVRLSNGDILYGLDPNNADTDGDGVPDGSEAILASKNFDQDPVYFSMLSDPTKKDSDGDGMSDKADPQPLVYNVTDRHNVMVSDLSYVNLESIQGTEFGGTLNEEIINRFKDSDAYPDIELAGWKIIKAYNSKWYNFSFGAVALKKGNDIIIAFRGTESETWEQIKDFANDLAIFINNDNIQTYNAEDFVASVIEENPRANIYITGHSLGGFLASVMSYELASLNLTNITGNKDAYKVFKNSEYQFIKGRTFNAAPFFINGYSTNLVRQWGIEIFTPYTDGPVTLSELLSDEYNDQIENYTTEGEFLSILKQYALGLRLGKVFEPFPSSGSMMERHSIYKFYEHFPLK
ncbi:S-layer homology domain-containing protein [Paenibacillus sp. A3M_27_13]|nr:S-layer homology domain-containing protein [Paenibacillus sp. A3M_27_13]